VNAEPHQPRLNGSAGQVSPNGIHPGGQVEIPPSVATRPANPIMKGQTSNLKPATRNLKPSLNSPSSLLPKG